MLTVPRSMAAITVTVDQGGAGFAANEDLSVKKVDPEGRCDEAGVTLGMYVVEFQGQPLAPGTTWATLRQMVKGAERPWSFVFDSCPPGPGHQAGGFATTWSTEWIYNGTLDGSGLVATCTEEIKGMWVCGAAPLPPTGAHYVEVYR